MEFLILVYVIILAIAVFINYLIATEFENIAKQKGYDQKKYFWYCFFLSMVGYLLVIALVPKNQLGTSTEKDNIPEI